VLPNAYPFGFQAKTCPGCKLVWANLSLLTAGIGPHADDAVGSTRSIEVGTIGVPL